jgi:hypothetical protein
MTCASHNDLTLTKLFFDREKIRIYRVKVMMWQNIRQPVTDFVFLVSITKTIYNNLYFVTLYFSKNEVEIIKMLPTCHVKCISYEQ